MNMRILVITQYYLPEPGATANRLSAFVDAMVKRGHQVTVICEFPNHPTGVLSRKDRWRLYRVEKSGGCRIIRTFVLAFPRKNFIMRMLFYLSFAFSSLVAGILIGKNDIVFASSPPPFCAYGAMIIAYLKRSKFVLDIRDLLTEAAQDMGTVKSNMLIRLGENLDRRCYKNASLIITATQGFKTQIDIMGGKGKSHVIYNGSDEAMLSWDGDKEEIRRSLGWDGKFIIGFMGLIGLPQNPTELLPEIACLRDEGLLFVFVGDGPGKGRLIKGIADLGIRNVRLIGHVTRDEAISLTHAADVMLIILRELEFSRSTIPSKFFDSMAAGKPIISNVDGELRGLMEKHKTGIYFSYGTENSFAKAVMTLYNDRDLRKTLGDNGRSLVKERFLRKNLALEAMAAIESLFKSLT